MTSDVSTLWELAALAGSDPKTHYRGANFRSSDLTKEDLRQFDLTGANWQHAKLTPEQSKYLKGRYGEIHDVTKAQTKSLSFRTAFSVAQDYLRIASNLTRDKEKNEEELFSEKALFMQLKSTLEGSRQDYSPMMTANRASWDMRAFQLFDVQSVTWVDFKHSHERDRTTISLACELALSEDKAKPFVFVGMDQSKFSEFLLSQISFLLTRIGRSPKEIVSSSDLAQRVAWQLAKMRLILLSDVQPSPDLTFFDFTDEARRLAKGAPIFFLFGDDYLSQSIHNGLIGDTIIASLSRKEFWRTSVGLFSCTGSTNARLESAGSGWSKSKPKYHGYVQMRRPASLSDGEVADDILNRLLGGIPSMPRGREPQPTIVIEEVPAAPDKTPYRFPTFNLK